MHPINNKQFGNATGRLAVKFFDGSSVVTGQVLKQVGSFKFKVAKIDGSGSKICSLAQTTNELTALTAGTGPAASSRATLCTIEITPHGGSAENVRKISTFRAFTIQGSGVTWKFGVASAAAGQGTMARVANAPTVANAIPNQVATVAGAFSYVIPANTFADANADTLTYSATLSSGAALSTVSFAFNASTRTLTKAATAGSTGTITVRVTASDGALTVFDDFNVVVS